LLLRALLWWPVHISRDPGNGEVWVFDIFHKTSHPPAITSEVAILCRSAGMLALSGRLKTRQKAILHEACHSGPLAGLAAGRGARGDAVMSALRMHMSELRGHHTVPVLVVVASKRL
jgi:hypothetical protein